MPSRAPSARLPLARPNATRSARGNYPVLLQDILSCPIENRTFTTMSTQSIAVHLPDGAIREVPAGTTPLEIANSISPRLAAAAVAARPAGRRPPWRPALPLLALP